MTTLAESIQTPTFEKGILRLLRDSRRRELVLFPNTRKSYHASDHESNIDFEELLVDQVYDYLQTGNYMFIERLHQITENIYRAVW